MPSALLTIVAALSLHLAGWTTFLWAQVANKEIETTEVRGKCLQPGGVVAETKSVSQALSLTALQH